MGGISLIVTTREKPEQSLFKEYLQMHPGMKVKGELGKKDSSKVGPGSNVELAKEDTTEDEPPLEIFGPDRVYEDEDMAPDVAMLISAPCWQIEIACEQSNEQNWTDAEDLAVYIAERYKGAVSTSEIGVVWPLGDHEKLETKPQFPPEGPEMDVLKLEWFAHSSKKPAKSARTFLNILRDDFKGALPVRFGISKPFQGQMSTEDDQPFLDAWEETRKEGGMLFFKSRSPCFGGHVSFPMTFGVREAKTHPLKPTEDIIRIQLEFDEGVLLQGDLGKVVDLFVALARGLECFYAHGFLERGYSWYRGGLLMVLGQTKQYPFPLGHEWMGIPPVTMWLSWFGRPYKELLMESVKRSASAVTEDGIFVRLGVKPADMHQLKTIKFDLPPELLAKRDDPYAARGDVEVGGAVTGWGATYKARKAELIPKLDE